MKLFLIGFFVGAGAATAVAYTVYASLKKRVLAVLAAVEHFGEETKTHVLKVAKDAEAAGESALAAVERFLGF